MNKKIIRSAVGLLPMDEIPGLEDFRRKHIHHPGRDVPFHVSLLYQFYLPGEMTDETEQSLKEIAESSESFEFVAHPLSSFPTTCALYMTPSPSSPFERLNDKLRVVFPQFSGKGYPVYHMTIASNYDNEKAIIDEFIKEFGYKSIELTAGHLAVFCECEDGKWKVYKTYPLGGA